MVAYPASVATAQGNLSSIIIFNATDANAIYGSSDTVQPPAISLIPQLRY